MTRLLVFDTETGGFDPLTCALLEIAVIATDAQGRIVARHHNLIKPVGEVEAQAVAVNGYNEAEWRFALQERDAITDLMGFLAEHPTELIVGHNVGFDVRFIEQAAFRCGLDVGLMLRRRVDTVKVFDARKLGVKNKRLSTIAKALGVTEPQKHRAMEDCEMLLECIRRYGLEVETRPPSVVDAEGGAEPRRNIDEQGVSWAPLWGGAGAHERQSDE